MQKLAFGTDGIRGRVGDFPFIKDSLYPLGAALGQWMVERYGSEKMRVKVLLAGDTRQSFDYIKDILIKSLINFPIEVVDAGVIPTPAVLTLIRKDPSFSCGIVISASHNPYYDNGIKLFDALFGKITPQDEHKIVELFEHYSFLEWKSQEVNRGLVLTWNNAEEIYINSIIQAVPAGVARNLKIVLDCAHGATYRVAPEIFKLLGAEVIVLNDSPNGTNINENSGALHPEALQNVVIAENAAIGFAFDGDGDRLVMVSHVGVAKDGDDVLTVLLDLDEYCNQSVVVGTVMSNSGLEAYLRERDKSFMRAAVGDKHIIAMLDEHTLFLGGEPSGHIILKNYLPSGDGILVAVKVLQSLQKSKKWALDHLVKYPQSIVNLPVAVRGNLQSEPFAGILRMYEQILSEGRILVRYSGTEPLLRIMVEGKDLSQTQKIAQQLAHDLQQAFNI